MCGRILFLFMYHVPYIGFCTVKFLLCHNSIMGISDHSPLQLERSDKVVMASLTESQTISFEILLEDMASYDSECVKTAAIFWRPVIIRSLCALIHTRFWQKRRLRWT